MRHQSDSLRLHLKNQIHAFEKMRLSVFLAATMVGIGFLHAQPIKADASMSPFPVRILDSQEVDFGDHTITYNLIETPTLKSQPTLEAVPQKVKEPILTAEELAEARRWESLRYECLGGSVTVLNGVGSEFRIWTPEGETVALSSIDFNFLQCFWNFERDGVYYSTLFCASDYSPEAFAEAKQADPKWATQLGEFPKTSFGMSHFLVISAPKGVAGENAIQALEDLHAYFDENRTQLHAAYEESEKARLAQEKWVRENPPVLKDTIINFFPIRSSTHPIKTSNPIEASRK